MHQDKNAFILDGEARTACRSAQKPPPPVLLTRIENMRTAPGGVANAAQRKMPRTGKERRGISYIPLPSVVSFVYLIGQSTSPSSRSSLSEILDAVLGQTSHPIDIA